MSTVAQLDKDGFFIGNAETYGGSMPHGCIEVFPEEKELAEYERWRWDGEQYTIVPDYRTATVYRPDGTLCKAEQWGPLPDGLTLTPPQPAPPTKEEAITRKLAEIMREYSTAFNPVDEVYPAAEREGWPVQEAEARALLADPQAETPVLSALVNMRARGESEADLAARIMENAGKWRTIYACLTGQQQRMYGEVSALADKDEISAEDVMAYPVSYAMPEGING